MFQGLVKDVKTAAASFIEQYLVRASVAIPFIIAFGFVTTALGMELTARFGAKNAFWIMAAVFLALGIVGAAVLKIREEAAAAEVQHAGESGLAELGEMASEAATHAAGRLPMGLVAPLLSNPSSSANAVARLLIRNFPLVLLLALVVLLLWPTEESTTSDTEEKPSDTPGDLQAAEPEKDPWREAA